MPKYQPFNPFESVDQAALSRRTWPGKTITKPPVWCSVDLRDGNQALAKPMNIEEKLAMFQLLLDIGFKEIEVGFPSASQIEFDFIRYLIENKKVPDDVFLQVLTQSREHLIRRTFESLKGARNVIIHLYNSTSRLQREITFDKSQAEIKKIAIEGTKLVKSLVSSLPGTKVRFEYSPESFSDTEIDYAIEVCEAVTEIWEPNNEDKIILNLPETVQWNTPNVYADQVEWFASHLQKRDKALISLHTHNDRGTGVASTELGILAGADRVEGTLFGNGERTGNLDIVTVALNMYSQGIDPGLKFDNLPHVSSVYTKCTKAEIPARQPYAGDLVFTAFSGSHQDAIKKGMDKRAGKNLSTTPWRVPYLLIDPEDIGRNYKAIIRINSQSGKGGVAYILSREFGLELPKAMHPQVGTYINQLADKTGRELTSQEIYQFFLGEFIERASPLKLIKADFISREAEKHALICRAEVEYQGGLKSLEGSGNGPIDAFVKAMEDNGMKDFILKDFHEHALGSGSDTEAMAYIMLAMADGRQVWGAGRDTNIDYAGLKALICAYNRSRDLA